MEQNNSVELTLNSHSDIYEVNYIWTIPKYGINKIYSENIKLTDDIECTMMLVPRIEHTNPQSKESFIRSNFTVFFNKVPADREAFFAVDVRTHKQFRIASTVFKEVTMSTKGYRGYRNNLSSNGWKLCLDKNYSLILNVKFTIKDCSVNSFQLEDFEKERSKLSQNIASLCNDMKYIDITLICANNDKVPANKAMLSARSPVLANILTSEIDTYEIGENFSKETVVEFVRFIYSNTIFPEKFDARVIELLQLASKFEVSELAKLCQQYIYCDYKTKLDEVSKEFKSLSCKEVFNMKNFAEINGRVKDLYEFAQKTTINQLE